MFRRNQLTLTDYLTKRLTILFHTKRVRYVRRREPRGVGGEKGHGPPRNFENWVVCAGMHLVRFEDSMIRKQAAKSELKNVAITQGAETTLCTCFTVLENVAI